MVPLLWEALFTCPWELFGARQALVHVHSYSLVWHLACQYPCFQLCSCRGSLGGQAGLALPGVSLGPARPAQADPSTMPRTAVYLPTPCFSGQAPSCLPELPVLLENFALVTQKPKEAMG